MLTKTQDMLGSKVYADKSSILSNTILIATFGAIMFFVFFMVPQVFKVEGAIWGYLAYGSIAVFLVLALIYFVVRKIKEKNNQRDGSLIEK